MEVLLDAAFGTEVLPCSDGGGWERGRHWRCWFSRALERTFWVRVIV